MNNAAEPGVMTALRFAYPMMKATEAAQTVEGRFWEKVAEVESGCWEWQAGKWGNGYGKFKLNKKSCLAHRISYELVNGELSANKLVCHTCDNRACVNPAHLYAGTHQDNVRDMITRGRSALNPRVNAGRILKTHCKNGHELSGDNLIARFLPIRQCRACTNERQKKYRPQKPE